MMDKLVAQIQEVMSKRNQTLSLAESCTGGAIAARLTKLAGCSDYFLGSLVAYSNQLKINVLQVDEKILNEHGAVSGPVVEGMARGIMRISGSDFGLAVSGIAGPGGGTMEKPVGTIWAAICGRESACVWSMHLSGSREEIIEQAVEEVLLKFWQMIQAI